jgi:hypothetical protein
MMPVWARVALRALRIATGIFHSFEQLPWARTSLLDPNLSLSVGAGPYLYFDTQPVGKDSKDVPGLGGVLTLAADYCLSNRWVLKLAYNHVATNDSDTDALLFGVGYQLDAPTSAGPRPWPKEQTQRTTGKELTVFVGNTILNTRNSEDSLATGVEYRRGIARYLDWTIGWMYEGDNDNLIDRNGIVTQLWPTRAFFENRLALAAGFGIYAAIDQDRDEGGDGTLAGLISVTGSYRFSEHYLVRATWYRTLTDYDHDTDILVLGLGYRFSCKLCGP